LRGHFEVGEKKGKRKEGKAWDGEISPRPPNTKYLVTALKQGRQFTETSKVDRYNDMEKLT